MVLTGAAGWLIWTGWTALSRAHLLGPSLRTAEHNMAGPVLLAVVVLVFMAERLWPAVPRRATARSHVVDAGYLGIFMVIAPLVSLLNTGFSVEISRHARFLLLGRLPLVPKVAAIAAILVGIDGFNWAAHMANHRLAAFWRFHALHHSQEDMSVFTTFRTHPLAHASYLPAVLPALVLGASGPAPASALVAYGCLVTLPHANLRWGYGRLGAVLVSPAFHRLHHADRPVNGKETVNFGFVLTCWDRMAGTAAYPDGSEPVNTGIGGRPVPIEQNAGRWGAWRVVGAQLAQPFRITSGLERERRPGATGPNRP